LHSENLLSVRDRIDAINHKVALIKSKGMIEIQPNEVLRNSMRKSFNTKSSYRHTGEDFVEKHHEFDMSTLSIRQSKQRVIATSRKHSKVDGGHMAAGEGKNQESLETLNIDHYMPAIYDFEEEKNEDTLVQKASVSDIEDNVLEKSYTKVRYHQAIGLSSKCYDFKRIIFSFTDNGTVIIYRGQKTRKLNRDYTCYDISKYGIFELYKSQFPCIADETFTEAQKEEQNRIIINCLHENFPIAISNKISKGVLVIFEEEKSRMAFLKEAQKKIKGIEIIRDY